MSGHSGGLEPLERWSPTARRVVKMSLPSGQRSVG